MRSTTVRYEKIQRQVKRRVECERCGKKSTRQTTLWQTLSPFNKNPDGSVKSRADIVTELAEQAKSWKPTTCAKCEAGS